MDKKDLEALMFNTNMISLKVDSIKDEIENLRSIIGEIYKDSEESESK